MSHLTLGLRLFSQNQYDISINREKDEQLLQKVESALGANNLIGQLMGQIASNCIELRVGSYLFIGQILKNGVDISQMLFAEDFLNDILQQINFQQPPDCVKHIAWCLYMITKRYYSPQLGSSMSDKA
mmetsp:Transcript_13198/g.9554  ORF Transcript_13198/g.9554 Transcript_13198/m.9554 type:complete len:128 (+) Transcript_13198:469-852(+)